MNKLKYILSTVVLTAFIYGCDVETASQDPSGLGSTEAYPTPSFMMSAGELTTNERDETVIVYNVTLDKPTNRPIDFSWVILDSSTATEHDDFDVVNGSVPAYQTTTQLSVTIYNDIVVEGTESLNLTIQSGPSLANQYLVNPDTTYPEVNVTIEDYLFCLWTLEATDTYGDGWNGAHINLTSEGVVTEYANEDLDGVTGIETVTFEIAIAYGADYSFEYVSGGGGFCGAPGYECENSFVLTAPDGTVFAQGDQEYGSAPTEGVITSGDNNICD